MATSDDRFTQTEDMNTAMYLFLLDYYDITSDTGTSNDDLNTLIQRWLAEGTAADSTRRWELLQRAAQGTVSEGV